jgi:inner membrane protease ATP23
MSEASFFDSITSKFSEWTGIGLPEAERAKLLEKQQCRNCEKWLAELQATSPIVRFMQQHTALLSDSGAPVPVVCAPCDQTQSGGFHPEYGVLICQNRLIGKQHMEDTLAHEMIHEYDQRRFKVDWNNLRHLACSEVSRGLCAAQKVCRKDNYRFERPT